MKFHQRQIAIGDASQQLRKIGKSTEPKKAIETFVY
jgi:hypothetical protein